MLNLALPIILWATLALRVVGHDLDNALLSRQAVDQQAEDLARKRMGELVKAYPGKTWTPGGSCTEENITVRKEWGDLTAKERRRYIEAIHCLHGKPSKTSPKISPGARNRFDDFVVAHMLNVHNVHFSPYLLSWHRHLVWTFEQELKKECGWEGGQPFWDWSKHALSPLEDLPLFDGSETSLSGNGVARYVDGPHNERVVCTCIESGPLRNWTVNIGPGDRGQLCLPNPAASGLDYNPRCLERWFDPSMMEHLTYSHVTDTILNHGVAPSSDGQRASFFEYIEEPFGIHAVPHTVIRGLQSDIPSAPADPWFFFHHTALDRAWIVWQSLDWDARKKAIATAPQYDRLRASKKYPPTPHVTLESTIWLSDFWENVTVADAMSPTHGRYCYRYD